MILAFDGHDGSGKTSLALRVAELSGASYRRPFAGVRGERLFALASAGRYEEANAHAISCVRRARGSDGARIVFDRHWMTVFTLLPQQCWDEWLPLPPTVLCWADLETTTRRLAQRERQGAGESDHERWLTTYRALSERFECEVVDTTTASTDDLARRLVGRLTG